MLITSNAIIGMIQVIVAAICWGTLGIFSTYLSNLGFTGWQISTLHIVMVCDFVILSCFFRVALTVVASTTADGFELNLGVLIGLLSGVCYSMLGIMGKKTIQNAGFAQSVSSPLRLIFFTSVMISAVALLFVPQTYDTYQTLMNLPLVSWWYVLGISLVGANIPFFVYECVRKTTRPPCVCVYDF